MLKGLEKSIVRINADFDCLFGKRRELGENKRDLGENKGLFQLFLYSASESPAVDNPNEER